MLSKRYKIFAFIVITMWTLFLIYVFGIEEKIFTKQTIDISKMGNISGLVSGGEEYLGVYFQERLIGYLFNKTERIGEKVVIHHQSELNLSVQGSVRKINIDGSAELSKEMLLNNFYFKITTENQDFVVTGKSDGKRLRIKSNLAGFKEIEVDNGSPVFLDVNLNRYIARRILQSTHTRVFVFKILSLEEMNVGNVEVEFVGNERIMIMDEEVYAYHLKKRYKNFRVDTWIDINGKTLKERNEMGFVLLREQPDRRKMKFSALDIVNQFSIYPDKSIPDIFSIGSISFRLSGVEFEGLLDGGRQRYKDGILTITSERIEKREERLSKEELERYKSPEAFVQSDSEEVMALAKKITEGSRDELDALERINDYLFANIKKKNIIGIPDAANTLKNMEGDCNEHAVFFVALARALGIPARIVGGVAYLNGRFYYHAWVEAYLDGWRSYDPTWGESPADVGHIRLVSGGIDKILDIAKYIGKLKIEVIEWK
ncbi:MAG: transglutaminase-like domain-containing protein [Myxococcota bacterium]